MNFFTVKTNLKINFPVIKTENIFSVNNLSLLTGRKDNYNNISIIIDKNVLSLYKENLDKYLNFHNLKAFFTIIDGEESSKTLDNAVEIIKDFEKQNILRQSSPIIIIGGGVTTDIGGFVSSIYRRGIPCIKIPTTVMGYVDAAIGIKTGVDFETSKNRLGTFTPPLAVLLTREFFKSLDDRHIRNGLAEICKVAIINNNNNLFNKLLQHKSLVESKLLDTDGDKILDFAIKLLLDELSSNLFESDLERRADFGHTFSLKLEMLSNGRLLHGEAVSIDMVLTTIIAYNRGMISLSRYKGIINLLLNIGLPITDSLITKELLESSVKERTLHRNGYQRIPMPFGDSSSTFINDLSEIDFINLLAKIKLF